MAKKTFLDFEQPIADLLDFIDWTPFFIAWEMKGIYPNILTDPLRGEEARKLFADAQALLRRVIDEKLLTARGVIGLWPATRDGDDIALQVTPDVTPGDTLDHHTHELAAGREELPGVVHLHTLRQQRDQTTPNAALADFILPDGDHIGAFAVAIHGAEELAAEIGRAHV